RAPSLRDGLEAPGVELEAARVGAFALDHLAHELGGLARDVRGADEHDLAPADLDPAHVAGSPGPVHDRLSVTDRPRMRRRGGPSDRAPRARAPPPRAADRRAPRAQPPRSPAPRPRPS